MPIWWGIYIGPQQQEQPDGTGPGCMTYPFGGCATQPMVGLHRITLRNINQHNSLLPPGVIRCNEANPCTDFVFDNVHSSGWWKYLKFNYISQNIEGTIRNSTPRPKFRQFWDESLPAEMQGKNEEVWDEKEHQSWLDAITEEVIDLVLLRLVQFAEQIYVAKKLGLQDTITLDNIKEISN